MPPKFADIHAISHDGRGIASIQGKTTFIENGLPDETVNYQLLRRHSHYDEGLTKKIIKASPYRQTPVCQHFGTCGGCSLQYMADELQLQFKEQALLQQLKNFGKCVPEQLLAPLSANSIHYRGKARLGVKFVHKKNKLLVGFREKKSKYLADLSLCKVLTPEVGENLTILSELIISLDACRHIAQVEVAKGDNAIALVFRHLVDLSIADIDKLREFGKQQGFHIYLQPNAPLPITKCYPEDNIERLSYELPEHQLQFLFHPLDFTQVNLAINPLMIAQALRLLDLQQEDHVLDLFCGIGNFALPIAKQVRLVTGIEGSEEMVARAYENAAHNHISNVEFKALNLMQHNLPALTTQKVNKILLDPPRTGAKEILPQLMKSRPKKIVYVSCNPATLSRDAEIIVHQFAYRLTHAGIINMFPHTAHTEAMAVFERD